MKVLLVDDDKAIIEVCRCLYLREHDVQTASDGLEGLAAAKRFKPDVIVSDVEMPGMSGPDFLDAYRIENQEVHAILISGRDLSSVCEKYPSAVNYAFLEKPFTGPEFRRVFSEVTQTS